MMPRVWFFLSLVASVRGWSTLQVRPSTILAVSTQKSFPAPLQRRLSLLEDHRLIHHPPPFKLLDELENEKNSTRRSLTRPRRPWKRLVLLAASAVVTASMLGLRSACAASTTALISSSDLLTQLAPVAPHPFISVAAAPAASAAVVSTSSSLYRLTRELQLMFRLAYASFMGACLGKERAGSARHHPAAAGVRTMSLVALGAATFTVCSAHGFSTGDPSRIAANVASGVGFVGAGVITTTTSSNGSNDTLVHGLTTAAAIWLSAAVGVASGVGLYGVSATGAALTIAIQRLGRKTPTRPHHESVKKSKSKQQTRFVVTSRAETGAPPDVVEGVPRRSQEQGERQDSTVLEGDSALLSRHENATFLDMGTRPSKSATVQESMLREKDVREGATTSSPHVDSPRISRSSAGGSSSASSSLPTSGITGSSTSGHRFVDSYDDDVIVHRHPLFIPETLYHDVQQGLLRKPNDYFSP